MSDPITPSPVPVNSSIEPDGRLAPVVKTAAWEDVLDIFYAPRQVFERRRDGKYLIPLLLLAAVTVATFFLSAQVNEALADVEFKRAMAAQTTKLTPEQMASAKAFAEKIKAVGVYFIPVFVVVGAWIGGVIILLLSSMMGGKLNFAQATVIGILSSMPELLSKVAIGAQGLFLDTATIVHKYSFSINAARFLPGTASSWMLKLGAIADPFVLWGTFLVGMGAWIIGRMEKEKAAVLAIIYLLVVTILIR